MKGKPSLPSSFSLVKVEPSVSHEVRQRVDERPSVAGNVASCG